MIFCNNCGTKINSYEIKKKLEERVFHNVQDGLIYIIAIIAINLMIIKNI